VDGWTVARPRILTKHGVDTRAQVVAVWAADHMRVIVHN